MKNIIIFGTGEFAKEAYLFYSKKNDINIIAFADNDREKHNTNFHDIKIISAEDILALSYDEIFIASSFDFEISNQLNLLKINSKKVTTLNLNDIKENLSQGDKLFLAEELMLDISEEFNKNDINYHIDHGTLLGIIRDNSIMPWDIDVDFAILHSEKDITIAVLDKFLKNYSSKYCLKNNWKCSLHNANMIINNKEENVPMVIKVFNDTEDITSNNFFVDIELKYLQDETLSWMIGSRKLSCAYGLCFPSSSIKFKNKLLQVPRNTHEYLESLYGDWKTVVKQWSYNQYRNIK